MFAAFNDLGVVEVVDPADYDTHVTVLIGKDRQPVKLLIEQYDALFTTIPDDAAEGDARKVS